MELINLSNFSWIVIGIVQNKEEKKLSRSKIAQMNRIFALSNKNKRIDHYGKTEDFCKNHRRRGYAASS